MSETTLPTGWVWTTIEDLANVATGATPLRSKAQYYDGGTIPWVTSGAVNNLYIDKADEHITDLAIKESNAKVFPAGALLVAMYGEGKTRGKVSELRISAATNQALAALLFDGLSEECKSYVKLFFLKNYADIRRLSSGGVQPNLNLSIIRKTRLPLPPLAEQHRIVAEIEKQLTRLEAGVAALHRAQTRLQRYKATVLKAACEGRLVPQDPNDEPAVVLLERILAERREQWNGKGKYKEPQPPDTDGLPELPKGWIWVSLESIATALGGYAFKSRNYSEDGYQIIKIGNVDRGQLDLDRRPSFIQNIDTKIKEKYLLRQGDIVITLTGTRKKRDYGFVAMVKNERNLLLNQRVARLRFYLPLNPAYFLIALQSEVFQDNFFKYETGNVGQGNVSMRAITLEPIPLPPLAEQQRIVAEVERRLSVVEEVEAALAANLHRAERLRQSILKQAFEGRLVPQDPADEPASVLLERIRAGKDGEKSRQLGLPGV